MNVTTPTTGSRLDAGERLAVLELPPDDQQQHRQHHDHDR